MEGPQASASYDYIRSSQVRRISAKPPTFWLFSVIADEAREGRVVIGTTCWVLVTCSCWERPLILLWGYLLISFHLWYLAFFKNQAELPLIKLLMAQIK